MPRALEGARGLFGANQTMPIQSHSPRTRADAQLEIRRIETLLRDALHSLSRLQQRISAGDAPHEVESRPLGKVVRERVPLDLQKD
jgi:hypothetical protein